MRLRRPTEAGGPHDDHHVVPCGRNLGGAYQRRARRVSIAVQKFDVALKTQAKGSARGHARGKVCDSDGNFVYSGPVSDLGAVFTELEFVIRPMNDVSSSSGRKSLVSMPTKKSGVNRRYK